MSAAGSLPFLSVIVPVHQGEAVLRESLGALAASDLPRATWELIVVDDGSTDDTSLIAAEFADVVVRLAGKPHGPAYGRNRGFEASRGEVIVFVDADACVHADALPRFAELFAHMPGLGAAFGSYDDRPTAQGRVSQFRNLLHHYVHQENPGDAETFWAGCGAIRRGAFDDVQHFNEWHYARPQIEDIEIGRRLRRAGYRILLCPEIQCTHLKHWSLGAFVETDFRHRGVPWTRLLLQEGPGESWGALNLRAREKWCAVLAVIALVLMGVAIFGRNLWALEGALAATLGVVVLNRGFYHFLHRQRGFAFALLTIPLHLLYYATATVSAVCGGLLHVLLGDPDPSPEVQIDADEGAATWPPTPSRPAAAASVAQGAER